MKHTRLVALLPLFSFAAAAAPRPNPFPALLQHRATTIDSDSLTVDLGYEVYQGFYNETLDQNNWMGIRYAAPPIGQLRWQAPQPPTVNRSQTLPAMTFASECPQSGDSNGIPVTNATLVGSEDCLFLNVYAPANASNLPVLVWIHGGGYGAGNGQQDLTQIISTNNNGFVGVAIQYRLGAFGFLSSDEVYRNGVVNAGLLDQHFALQWVQSYIHLFGGNASQVTISGESAGGGSVMLHSISYGGTLGTSLFKNLIASSPYLPQQYSYSDWIPSQSYYAFAAATGCLPNIAYGAQTQTIFQCLQGLDTITAMNASAYISASGTFGTWGFLPVTDGAFVPESPSQALLKRRINGLNLLAGNNANEGAPFVVQNITTYTDLLSWLHLQFPLFHQGDIEKLLLYYPGTNATDNPNAPFFATTGTIPKGPSALNESQLATGQQQRADNVYAETTFVCPSYWMVEAYSDVANVPVPRSSFKYQYSVPTASHGEDVVAVFGQYGPNISPEFNVAFATMWGNFIMYDNPSVPDTIANNTAGTGNPLNPFPPFTLSNPLQVILNETGGTPYSVLDIEGAPNVTQFMGAGLQNDFSVVNPYTFEAGRGLRCDFWQAISAIVPE